MVDIAKFRYDPINLTYMKIKFLFNVSIGGLGFFKSSYEALCEKLNILLVVEVVILFGGTLWSEV